MRIDVQIDGIEKFTQATRAIQKSIQNEFKIALKSSGEQVRGAAIKSIKSGNKSGAVYTHYFATNKLTGGIYPAKKRSKPHRASAAGEAPATDTGNLDGSISTVPRGEDTVLVTARAKYASFLEFGTAKIAPRPFMFPALEMSKAWIQARFKKAIKDGIEKGKK